MTSRALNQTISSSPKSTLNIPSYDREIRTPKSIRSFLDISMLPPPSPPRDLRHELAAKTKLLETADISQLIDFYPHPEPSDPLPELPTFGALEPESAIGDETLKSLINRFQMNRPDISVSTAFDNPEANSFQGIGNLEPTPISSPRVKMIQAIGAKRSQLFTSKLSFSVPSFPASKGLSISNDNRGAVSSHGCRQIHVFDLDNPQFVPLLRASSPMSSKENAWNVSTSNFSRFTDFSLCPVNGDILGALDTKGLLHVWKFQNPSKTSKLELSSDDHMAILPGGALSFHPFDPSTLATCYITGLLKIFDIEKQMVKNSIEEFNKQNVYSISWMPCGTMLGTSGEDRFAKIFDTRFKNSLVAVIFFILLALILIKVLFKCDLI